MALLTVHYDLSFLVNVVRYELIIFQYAIIKQFIFCERIEIKLIKASLLLALLLSDHPITG